MNSIDSGIELIITAFENSIDECIRYYIVLLLKNELSSVGGVAFCTG
jgi:hypothetical protein